MFIYYIGTDGSIEGNLSSSICKKSTLHWRSDITYRQKKENGAREVN